MSYTINGTPIEEIAESCRLTRTNQGTDTLELSAVLPGVADADLYAYGSTVTLMDGATTLFTGRVTQPGEIDASGGAQQRSITMAGPWWYLEKYPYTQTWNGATQHEKTRVVFYQKAPTSNAETDPVPVSLVTQLSDILNNAISQGAPIQIGSLPFHDLTPPYAEMKDLMCADALRAVLRWLPDAAIWWDYTALPFPAIHIGTRRDLPGSEIALSEAAEGARLKPRYDLCLPGVRIYYEISTDTTDEDGNSESKVTVETRNAGAPTAPGALHLTISLDGGAIESLAQWIKTSPVAVNPNDEEFWKVHNPTLKQQDSIDDILITHGQLLDDKGAAASEYYVEVLEGGVPNWLSNSEPETPYMKQVTAYAKCSVRVRMSDSEAAAIGQKRGYRHEDQRITYSCLATKVAYSHFLGHTFRRTRRTRAAETVPTGLESAIYDATQELHYEGSVRLTAQAPAWALTPGCVLNVTGGRAELETARMQIQQVSHTLETGTTEVTVGPPQHLSPQDLMTLAKGNKATRTAAAYERSSGKAPSGNLSGGANTAPNPGAMAAAERAAKEMDAAKAAQTWQSNERPDASVSIDTAHLDDITDPPISDPCEVKLRRVWLVVDGAPSFAAMMMSAPETLPGA